MEYHSRIGGPRYTQSVAKCKFLAGFFSSWGKNHFQNSIQKYVEQCLSSYIVLYLHFHLDIRNMELGATLYLQDYTAHFHLDIRNMELGATIAPLDGLAIQRRNT